MVLELLKDISAGSASVNPPPPMPKERNLHGFFFLVQPLDEIVQQLILPNLLSIMLVHVLLHNKFLTNSMVDD